MVHLKPTGDTRKPYSGPIRSLVIAIDVGTTFSGVSYAILEPGDIPKIHGVTRYPGQEHVAGNSKIPSVLYYDKHGKMMACGAEADTASVVSQAEDEGWIKAELFKLRLRPRTMQLNMNGMRLGPLPRRKTAVDVFGDFLSYLYRCTRNFITDTHANGPALWNAVEHDIQFVLSHPNGWEGAQQSKMRRSAVYGGLIPDTNEGKARIRFVTEGEASLHACVLNGLAADVLSNPSKHGFLIADAGGGTLDISSYAIRGTAPLVMEEIAPPDCLFAGSVFVSRRAREFLQEKLKNSKYGTPDAVDHITKRFDETTKRLFRDRRDLQFIPFGSPLDKDLSVGIRGGQLKLTGDEVADLFEPSVQAAFTAIKAQIDASAGVIRSVFLVGGYAASPWLFGQLQERLAAYNITVSRPDTQTSKAVADGAIGFYCDHHVSARMSRFMYGVEFLRELDPNDPDHVSRRERLLELPSGPKLLPDAFDCILARSVKVKESTVFTRKYCTELTSLSLLSVFEVDIWCYRGGNTIPKWINRLAEDFSTLCVVRADLSPLAGSAEPKTGRGGKTYWTIVFSVEIHFGLTEFRARIKWVDDGKTRYGPASIVYNERGHRAEEDEPDSWPEDDIAIPSRSDKYRSEPASRARSPEPYSSRSGESSKRASVYDLPKTDTSFLEVRDVVRERTVSSKTRSSSSRPSPTTPTTPTHADRDRDRDRDREARREERERAADRDRGRDKEKARELDTASSRHEDRSRGMPSKLADELGAVWGADATPSRSSAPPLGPSRSSDSQTATLGRSPKVKGKEREYARSPIEPPAAVAAASPPHPPPPVVTEMAVEAPKTPRTPKKMPKSPITPSVPKTPVAAPSPPPPPPAEVTPEAVPEVMPEAAVEARPATPKVATPPPAVQEEIAPEVPLSPPKPPTPPPVVEAVVVEPPPVTPKPVDPPAAEPPAQSAVGVKKKGKKGAKSNAPSPITPQASQAPATPVVETPPAPEPAPAPPVVEEVPPAEVKAPELVVAEPDPAPTAAPPTSEKTPSPPALSPLPEVAPTTTDFGFGDSWGSTNNNPASSDLFANNNDWLSGSTPTAPTSGQAAFFDTIGLSSTPSAQPSVLDAPITSAFGSPLQPPASPKPPATPGATLEPAPPSPNPGASPKPPASPLIPDAAPAGATGEANGTTEVPETNGTPEAAPPTAEIPVDETAAPKPPGTPAPVAAEPPSEPATTADLETAPKPEEPVSTEPPADTAPAGEPPTPAEEPAKEEEEKGGKKGGKNAKGGAKVATKKKKK